MRTQTSNPDHIRGRKAEERCVRLLLKIGYIARTASHEEDYRGIDVVVYDHKSAPNAVLYLQVKSNVDKVREWRRKHPELVGIAECVVVAPHFNDARVIARIKIALAKIREYHRGTTMAPIEQGPLS